MSGKRRRCESSWEMKKGKRRPTPPENGNGNGWQEEKELNSKSNDPCWGGNKNDDISSSSSSRDRHRAFDDDEWERPYSTRDGSRRSRDWEFRQKCGNEYGRDEGVKKDGFGDRSHYSRDNNLEESWSRRPNHSGGQRFPHHRDDGRRHRQSNQTQVQCKFFAAGRCNRDDCKFSHDAQKQHHDDPRPSSHDNIWVTSDLSEKTRSSWGGGGGGLDKRSHNNNNIAASSDEDKKKKKKSSSWDDKDNRNRSWDEEVNASSNNFESGNGRPPLWVTTDDDPVLNEKDYLFPGQGKASPKRKKQELVGVVAAAEQQEEEEEEEEEKIKEEEEEGIMGQRRSPSTDNDRRNEYGRNCKAAGDYRNGKSHSHQSSRSIHNSNSRNHYGDGDGDGDGRRQSNPTTSSRRIQCKFFAAGRCNRDDCNFSHDAPPHSHLYHHDKCHDRHPHAPSHLSKNNNNNNNKSWDDVESGGGFVESRSHNNNILGHTDSDHKNKSWAGASNENNWDFHHSSVDKKKSSQPNLDDKKKSWGDGFNGSKWDSHNSDDKKKPPQPNSDNKNGSWNGHSWDEVDAAKSGDEKTKSWVQMDDENKNDYFLPQQQQQQHNHSHLQIPPQQNITNAIHYLNSLPDSTHTQDTRPKEEGIIANDVMKNIGNPKNKLGSDNRVAEIAKQQEEEKVNNKEGNTGNDEKCMRQFRIALVEFVKEILKPKWKEGKMTREVYKTLVKKVVDKITTSIQEIQIPTTQPKIQLYLTRSKPKIMKLVEAYIGKLAKA